MEPTINPVPSIEVEITSAKQKRNVPMMILTALVFLIPVFFIPSHVATGSAFAKMLLYAILVLGAFSWVLVQELREKSIRLPVNVMTVSALLIPLAYIVSSFFAPSFRLSFFGQGFESDTVFASILFFLAFIVTALSCRNKGNAVYTLVALLASFALLALFHIIRLLFGADVLAFGIFTDRTSSLVGKWNDAGVFFGLITLLSWLAVEQLSLRGLFAAAMWTALAGSLALVAVVNFSLVWIVLGTIAASALMYHFFTRKRKVETPETGGGQLLRIPIASIVILLLSITFTLDAYSPALFGASQARIGGVISSRLQVTQLEARPSWKTTYTIGKEVYAKSPLFGSGPNTFSENWLAYRPEGINQTLFWNTLFTAGIGVIPTSFITTGILGGLTWVLFLCALLYLGFRAFRATYTDTLVRYLTFTTFLMSVYLWFFAIAYVPSLALLILAALFSGLFVSLLYEAKVLYPRVFVFASHPRTGFALSLILIVLLVVTVTAGYGIVRKSIASAYFEKSVKALGEQNIEQAHADITRAIAISDSDRFEQMAAQIALSRIGAWLANNQNPSAEQNEELRQLVSDAVARGLAATNYNARNYYNWMTLGQVYESLAQLNVGGAYDNAKTTYKNAEELNPMTPSTALAFARLEVIQGNIDGARALVQKALAIKSDYRAATLLLAQIEITAGNSREAIASLRQAIQTSPGSPLLFFQLGFLEYSAEDYMNAIHSLEQAVGLDESYANARYFLGLSYYRVGRVVDAIAQFERVQETNPDVVEVQQILTNLRAGKDPLSGGQSQDDRLQPPINE